MAFATGFLGGREDATKTDLDLAWQTLREAKVEAIANISMGELGRMLAGNPHYSAAEQRMAGGLLVLRAALEMVAS